MLFRSVIVNGGLGPTVDDLSQEIAAQAAGVELVLNEEWLVKMEDFFTKRARVMPPNNRKQAMLPATAEMIDNPIGTACGFAVDIGKARNRCERHGQEAVARGGERRAEVQRSADIRHRRGDAVFFGLAKHA